MQVPDRPAYWTSKPMSRADALDWLKRGSPDASEMIPTAPEPVRVYGVEECVVRLTRQPDKQFIIEVWDDKPGTAGERIAARLIAVYEAQIAFYAAQMGMTVEEALAYGND